MKLNSILLLVLVVLVGIAALRSVPPARAQNPDLTPFLIQVNGNHSLCPIVVNATRYCFADDGPYWSLKGAAYTSMLGTAPAGVTSFNGFTGAVTSAAAGIKYADLVNKPTGLACTNSTQDNAGFRCPAGTLALQ